ncbi:zinc ABC transporter substrate-binding protein [Microlunatus panaciterrae]|uniref:Zinc transport system substrate-binding protein n=1 Tax=Microlunatus panaciterrae TaxID=400768 RepID=A0ABS2RFK0_9ACTN|nr:metal ABC transporter substrate-binding protein [Microlunatus panaciterrae]MBM7797771.1 zinc transport system substrate-binding protein [Microlunatus panaciterrae]
MLNLSGRTAALLCAMSVLLAACGSTGGPSGAQPGQLRILAAFYPLQFIAERVAGGHARVDSLTQPGAEPHDVELTPRQVAAVADADLVVYERSFQAAVDEAISQSGTKRAFDTTTVVPLQPAGRPHQEGDPGSDPSGVGKDPHVWLDPTNVATIARAVSDRLAGVDPRHADDYRANATALTHDLSVLDGDFKHGLASCARTEFITTHAAFGYLARRYGLTQIGISGLSPDTEPSPARMAEVQAEARAHQITTIFYESLVSPAVAQAIASDLKLKIDVLDPVEGLTARSRGRDYLEVMRANLTALEAANGCR